MLKMSSSLKRKSGFALAAVLMFSFAAFADVSQGVRLFEEKKYSEAERVLREAVGSEPDNAEANYYLGLTLLELKKYEESESALRKAVDAKPEARVGLAQALMMQERLDDASGELDRAANDVPDNPALHRTRGMISLKHEKYDVAARHLAKALDLDPKDAYANYYYGMANSRLRRTDLMIKHFQIFLELAPNAPEAAKVRSLLRSL